jgi:hypothetical protein
MARTYPPVEDPLVIFTGPSPRGWHRLQQAAKCLQKYAWGYLNGPKEDISHKPALATGTLIHLVLAQHYSQMKQVQEGKNPNEFMDPMEAARMVAEGKGYPQYLSRVAPTYSAYRKHYSSDIRNRRIVAVETLFDGTVGPFRLTGRIDLMYEDLAGRLIAEDHKSTGRLTKSHKDYFSISGQLLGYQHIVRQKHPELAGFSLNLIQHTKPKFERLMLPRSPEMERQFEARAVDIERSIEQIEKQGRPVDEWPRAMSELVCFHRYGPCDHIDKCRYGGKAKKAGSWEWTG